MPWCGATRRAFPGRIWPPRFVTVVGVSVTVASAKHTKVPKTDVKFNRPVVFLIKSTGVSITLRPGRKNFDSPATLNIWNILSSDGRSLFTSSHTRHLIYTPVSLPWSGANHYVWAKFSVQINKEQPLRAYPVQHNLLYHGQEDRAWQRSRKVALQIQNKLVEI